jgi:hypothetical protein
MRGQASTTTESSPHKGVLCSGGDAGRLLLRTRSTGDPDGENVSTFHRLQSAAPGVTVMAATPSVTITSPGMSATDSLTVTSVGNYAGSVNLSCAVSYTGSATIQVQPTCLLSSSSVSVTAGGTSTSTLSVSTTAPQTSSKQEGPASSGFQGSGGIAFSFVLLGLTGVFAKRKDIDRGRVLGIMLVLATSSALLCATGCTPHPTTPGTTPATYTVTISGGPGTPSGNLASLSVDVQ